MSNHNQAFDLIKGDGSHSSNNVIVKAATAPRQRPADGSNNAAASDHNQQQISSDDNKTTPLKSASSSTILASTLDSFITDKGRQPPIIPNVSSVGTLAPNSKSDDGYQLKPRENNHFIDISNSSEGIGGPSSRRIKFRSLLEPAVINESDETTTTSTKFDNIKRFSLSSDQELIDLTSFNGSSSSTARCDTGVGGGNNTKKLAKQKTNTNRYNNSARTHSYLNETIIEEEDHYNNINDDSGDSDSEYEHDNFFDDEYDADSVDSDDEDINNHAEEKNNISISPSHHRLKSSNTLFDRFYRRLKYLGADLTSKITNSGSSSSISYTAYEDTQSATTSGSARKYRRLKKHKNPEQNFRGCIRPV